MGAEATAINVTATGVVVGGPSSLRGVSIRDTSGATNTVKIFDNATTASGTVLFSFQLAANASVPPLAIDDGLRAANGLFLQATGAIEGSVWIG